MDHNDWQTVLNLVARAFRLGREADGNARLNRLITLLPPYLPLLAPEELVRLNLHLQSILQAQSRRDFLLISDLLEYEVLPILRKALPQILLEENIP